MPHDPETPEVLERSVVGVFSGAGAGVDCGADGWPSLLCGADMVRRCCC